MIRKSFITLTAIFALGACDKIPGTPIYKAHKVVSAEMIDPSSTQFRNDIISKTGAVCGEVNAKNRMGGYVGFMPYYVESGVAWTIKNLPDFEIYLDAADNHDSETLTLIGLCCFNLERYVRECPEQATAYQVMNKKCGFVDQGTKGLSALRKAVQDD